MHLISRICLIFIMVFPSCRPENKNKKIKNSPIFKAKPVPLVVGAGDLLQINSFNAKLPSGTFFVSETGHINYPFLGKIKVGGKKLEDVNKFIIASLKDGFFRNPMITVTFKSNTSQKITIYGNVNKPQIMPYQPEMTFLQAITMAGGLSKQAARDAITIMRKYKGKKFRVRISIDDIIEGRTSDFYLLPGDIIIVGESLL